jgi:hypothetical protein
MFALNDIRSNPELSHLENLRGANYYCTAAVPRDVERRIYKRNPVPEDTGAGKMGLMEIEYYLPGSRFQFLVLSRDGSPPPDMIHYGKKRAPCRLAPDSPSNTWDMASVPFGVHQAVVIRPAHLINPLDYEAITETSYARKLPMKPSPLYYLSAMFANVLVANRSKVVLPNPEGSTQWS